MARIKVDGSDLKLEATSKDDMISFKFFLGRKRYYINQLDIEIPLQEYPLYPADQNSMLIGNLLETNNLSEYASVCLIATAMQKAIESI